MCKKLSSLKVPIGTGEEFNFKKLMITKCQREFEKTDNEHNEKLLAERSKAVTAETVCVIFGYYLLLKCALHVNYTEVIFRMKNKRS